LSAGQFNTQGKLILNLDAKLPQQILVCCRGESQIYGLEIYRKKRREFGLGEEDK